MDHGHNSEVPACFTKCACEFSIPSDDCGSSGGNTGILAECLCCWIARLRCCGKMDGDRHAELADASVVCGCPPGEPRDMAAVVVRDGSDGL